MADEMSASEVNAHRSEARKVLRLALQRAVDDEIEARRDVRAARLEAERVAYKAYDDHMRAARPVVAEPEEER